MIVFIDSAWFIFFSFFLPSESSLCNIAWTVANFSVTFLIYVGFMVKQLIIHL